MQTLSLDTSQRWAVRDYGEIPYGDAYALQKEHLAQVIRGGKETLLLCEHPPVLTLGRLSCEENILIPFRERLNRKIKVFSVDRGGDVTLHCPGQLVAYPILDLRKRSLDLRAYLRELEQVILDFLKGFDILSHRVDGRTGVWIRDRKVASIGIGVKKWVAFHGLAVNLDPDLELFRMIRPCGMDITMTSVAREIGKEVNCQKAKMSFEKLFRKRFFVGD